MGVLLANSMVKSAPLTQEETSHALVMEPHGPQQEETSHALVKEPHGSQQEEQPCWWELCDLPCAHVAGGDCALQTAHAVSGGGGGCCGGQRWQWGSQMLAAQMRLLMQWWGC